MMAEEFHEFIDVVEVGDVNALTIARARTLCEAVKHQRDYSIVRLLRHGPPEAPKYECVVVDVEVDGVPPKNPFGIEYRERLALCVPSNPAQLVEVRALRKSFPVLMHQNQGVPGEAASLCLYFEQPAAVLRTWTPQGFLRRIQWWLEKSARGELHPADQPVENLFFATKYELVLPWNFEDLQKDTTRRFVIRRGESRPDHGFTCFVESEHQNEHPGGHLLSHVTLELPPIVHGFVERDPQTLGQLADLMAGRGIDIVPPLHIALGRRVGAQGIAESADDAFTVILMRIPIARVMGGTPEGVSSRAFLIPVGTVKLGVAMGLLHKHEQRYFKVPLLNGDATATAWRSEQIFPMDVRRRNDAASARHQSGIADTGPVGLVVGGGSLGSAMLNLWGRSGWGNWTVIDNDHVKPHNLSRHHAYSQHVGATKVAAIAQLHDAVMHGASRITPIWGDACDPGNTQIASAISDAKLVVDASTTLEYPRMASRNDAAARHMSVFVLPNGNASVLLAEDERRTLRLRTLEAQYYRAVIREEWGRMHLAGNMSSFWSGASCRDISLVMPYSKILAHACTLEEQVRSAFGRSTASIRVWQRDQVNGRVDAYDVQTYPEQRFAFDDLDLFIDEGAQLQLRQLRRDCLPEETGGVLLGYYDFNIKAAVIVCGLPAPPDSSAGPGFFERGIQGLADAVLEASRRTAGVVGYIGEWHSHPRGHSAAPSRDDLMQLLHLAMGMSLDGLPAIQLIVGERDIHVIQGTLK